MNPLVALEGSAGGAATAAASSSLKRVALSFLWLVLALYDFGFRIHWPAWERANWLVPPLVSAAAFGFIGWKLNISRRKLNE